MWLVFSFSWQSLIGQKLHFNEIHLNFFLHGPTCRRCTQKAQPRVICTFSWYLPGILQFCTLHSCPWSILSSFFRRVSGFIFFFCMRVSSCPSSFCYKDSSLLNLITFSPKILHLIQRVWVFPQHPAILGHQLGVRQLNSVLTLSTSLIWY